MSGRKPKKPKTHYLYDPSTNTYFWNWKEFWNGVGAFTTFNAMVGQGLFSGLLADEKISKNWSIEARITVFLIFAACGEEGKRRIVRFFNQEAFKNLAHKKISPLFLPHKDAKGTEYHAYLNLWQLEGGERYRRIAHILWNTGILAQSIIIAGTFAGLSNVSFNQSANLFNTWGNKDNKHLRAFTDTLRSRWLQMPIFATSSFIGNLMSFPGILSGAYALIASAFEYLCINPAYRKQLNEENAKIDAMRESLRALTNTLNIVSKNEKKSDENLGSFGTATRLSGKLSAIGFDLERADDLTTLNDVLNNALEKTLTAKKLRQGLLQYYDGNKESLEKYYRAHEGPVELALRRFTDFILMTSAIIGFQNFYQMPAVVAMDWGYKSISTAASLLLGIPVYWSMIAMSLVAAHLTAKFIMDCTWQRDKHLNFDSTTRMATRGFSVLAICALGGFPNAYQALLAPKTFINADSDFSFSLISPLIIEFSGFFALLAINHLLSQVKQIPEAGSITVNLDHAFEAAKSEGLETSAAPTGSVQDEDSPITPKKYYDHGGAIVAFFKDLCRDGDSRVDPNAAAADADAEIQLLESKIGTSPFAVVPAA